MTSYTKMNTVCVRGFSKSEWLDMKAEAAKANKTIAEFISMLFFRYKSEKPKSNWDALLDWKPTMTPEEADKMEKEIYKAFRTETEFR